MTDKITDINHRVIAGIEARRKVAERFTRIREEEGVCPGQMYHDGKAYCAQSRFTLDLLCPETSADYVSVRDREGKIIVCRACNYRGQKIRIK